jgi:hypothetical protein
VSQSAPDRSVSAAHPDSIFAWSHSSCAVRICSPWDPGSSSFPCRRSGLGSCSGLFVLAQVSWFRVQLPPPVSCLLAVQLPSGLGLSFGRARPSVNRAKAASFIKFVLPYFSLHLPGLAILPGADRLPSSSDFCPCKPKGTAWFHFLIGAHISVHIGGIFLVFVEMSKKELACVSLCYD